MQNQSKLKIMFIGRQSGEMGNYLDFRTLIISGGIFLMCLRRKRRNDDER